jgi:signal transduction histidine kinase
MPDRLTQAALDLTSHLELPQVLQGFVDAVAALTGAAYSALEVVDPAGRTTLFIQHGLGGQDGEPPACLPAGLGILGEIPVEGALIINNVATRPDIAGWPDAPPRMASFLGMSLRLDRRVYGRIYAAGKAGGFTSNDVAEVEVLAQAAGIAIANSQRYREARAREWWMRVSQEITTLLLEGAEEEQALQTIASRVRQIADADTCLLILPSVKGLWLCEIADGYLADTLLGVTFPEDGRAVSVLRGGMGVLVDSLADADRMLLPALRRFGPGMYAPMTVRGSGRGVILLLRRVGEPAFDASDLARAESLAQQTAVALELAASRHSEDETHLLEERQRISRDLHDLAIQQLFAAGMRMEAARLSLVKRHEPDLAGVLDEALVAVDESVRQIRSIVRSLREEHVPVDLLQRLRREASIGRTALGFAPTLVVRLDGRVVTDADDFAVEDFLAHRVDPEIADDVVAVVREGLSNAARHAHASEVRVELAVDGEGASGCIRVLVDDDGAGLGAAPARRSGLDNLLRRARRHQGSSRLVGRVHGRGTVLTWQVPLG